MEAVTEVARPKIKEVKIVMVEARPKELALRTLDYAFIVSKSKKGLYHITVAERRGADDAEIICEGRFGDETDLQSILLDCGSSFLNENHVEVASGIWTHIQSWKTYLLKEKARQILLKPCPKIWEGISLGLDNSFWTIISLHNINNLKSLSFENLTPILSKIWHDKLAEVLEVVISNALTLRQVDRSKGIYKNRPNWLAIVGDPSTYKTSTLDLLRMSRYAFFANQITAASLLSAKPDVQPLIDLINGKAFIIPTLTEETADKDRARKIFAALESIYDGFYGKATGMSGYQGKEVDTVVIAAVTPAIWNWVLDYLQNIGSRWLVYWFELSDEEAIEIQLKLDKVKGAAEVMSHVVSTFFDKLMSEVTHEVLSSVQVTEQQRNDLIMFARLVSRLRAVLRFNTYWEEDEETGRRKPHVELEVVQREAPGRAFQSLLNFVRANTIVRKSSAEKILGLPVVSEHSMKLAFKLALGSTDLNLSRIYVYLVKHSREGTAPSVREISSALGIKKSTVQNRLMALRHPKIDLIDENNVPYEDFAQIVRKYLGSGDDHD